jgi:hypothetical protein
VSHPETTPPHPAPGPSRRQDERPDWASAGPCEDFRWTDYGTFGFEGKEIFVSRCGSNWRLNAHGTMVTNDHLGTAARILFNPELHDDTRNLVDEILARASSRDVAIATEAAKPIVSANDTGQPPPATAGTLGSSPFDASVDRLHNQRKTARPLSAPERIWALSR